MQNSRTTARQRDEASWEMGGLKREGDHRERNKCLILLMGKG